VGRRKVYRGRGGACAESGGPPKGGAISYGGKMRKGALLQPVATILEEKSAVKKASGTARAEALGASKGTQGG